MKQLFLILICSIFFVAAGAQTNYNEAMHQGDSLLRIEKYDEAITKYFAAEAFDPLQKKEVKKMVDSALKMIKAQKKFAEEKKVEADSASAREKRSADTAKLKQLQIERINLSNAPYKYIRLIRDGPKEESKIKRDSFDLKLIAYSNHLDTLKELLKDMPKERNDYKDLREKLYYNNELYEKIYACLEYNDAKPMVLKQIESIQADYFSVQFFSDSSAGFKLSNDSGRITAARSDIVYETPGDEGRKFTSFTLSNKLKRIFCATDDNYIIVYNSVDFGKHSNALDTIALGTKVTAIDFDDNNSIIYFGTVKGDIGFIKYNNDRKNQPVYDLENALGSQITAMDVFEYAQDTFLLATGQNSKAVVYKTDNHFLEPGNKFSGNILPDQDLGYINHATFDTLQKQVILETFKAGIKTIYLWDPITKRVLEKYKQLIKLPPEILEANKFY